MALTAGELAGYRRGLRQARAPVRDLDKTDLNAIAQALDAAFDRVAMGAIENAKAGLSVPQKTALIGSYKDSRRSR